MLKFSFSENHWSNSIDFSGENQQKGPIGMKRHLVVK